MKGFRTRVTVCHFSERGWTLMLCGKVKGARSHWSDEMKDITCQRCRQALVAEVERKAVVHYREYGNSAMLCGQPMGGVQWTYGAQKVTCEVCLKQIEARTSDLRKRPG